MDEKEQEKTKTDNKQLDAETIANIVYTFLKKVGCYHTLRLIAIRKSYRYVSTGNGWVVYMTDRPLTTIRVTISGTGKIISIS